MGTYLSDFGFRMFDFGFIIDLLKQAGLKVMKKLYHFHHLAFLMA